MSVVFVNFRQSWERVRWLMLALALSLTTSAAAAILPFTDVIVASMTKVYVALNSITFFVMFIYILTLFLRARTAGKLWRRIDAFMAGAEGATSREFYLFFADGYARKVMITRSAARPDEYRLTIPALGDDEMSYGYVISPRLVGCVHVEPLSSKENEKKTHRVTKWILHSGLLRV